MKSCSILVFLICLGFHSSEPASWDEVKAISQQEKKPILLVFSGSDWCKPCIRFQQEVLDDLSTSEFLSNHTLLYKADFPRQKKNQPNEKVKKTNEELFVQYNPNGLFPMILLLDGDGKVLSSYSHFIDKDQLVSAVQNGINQ